MHAYGGAREDRTSRVARQRENDQERDHRVHCLLRSSLAEAWRATSHRTSTRSLHTTRVCTAQYCSICKVLSHPDGLPGLRQTGFAEIFSFLGAAHLARSASRSLLPHPLPRERAPRCTRCLRSVAPNDPWMGPAPTGQGQAMLPFLPVGFSPATITSIWRCWTEPRSEFPESNRTTRTAFYSQD